MAAIILSTSILTTHEQYLSTFQLMVLAIQYFAGFSLDYVVTEFLKILNNPIKSSLGIIIAKIKLLCNRYQNYLDSLIAACAAARRAIGTRNGEHDT